MCRGTWILAKGTQTPGAGMRGRAPGRLALCMGKPAEAEAPLLKAFAVPEEGTAAIGFMQPDDAPVIPTAYARKRPADMAALRHNPRLLAALAPFRRILPFALSDGRRKRRNEARHRGAVTAGDQFAHVYPKCSRS